MHYNVYQTCRTRPARIDIYDGFSIDAAKKAVKESEEDLSVSLLGHRWQTCVRFREVTDWQELDKDSFLS